MIGTLRISARRGLKRVKPQALEADLASGYALSRRASPAAGEVAGEFEGQHAVQPGPDGEGEVQRRRRCRVPAVPGAVLREVPGPEEAPPTIP